MEILVALLIPIAIGLLSYVTAIAIVHPISRTDYRANYLRLVGDWERMALRHPDPELCHRHRVYCQSMVDYYDLPWYKVLLKRYPKPPKE